jgi:N-carbamoylputrescine amidase
MKLALIQMQSAVGQVEENIATASPLIDEACAQGARLLVLPEFWSTGYFPLSIDYSFYDLADGDDGPAMACIKAKVREHGVHIVSTMYERQGPGLYYNTAMVVNPEGEVISKYRKVHVPARRGLEKLYYRGGSKFPVVEVEGWRVGMMLCYDSLFPEPARCLALGGAELIVVPFGASTTEGTIWDQLMMTRAFENGAYVAPCNAVGPMKMPDGEPFILGGKSLIANPSGQIIAQANASEETIVYGDLDLKEVNDIRNQYFMFRDRRPDTYGIITTTTEDISG